MNWRDVTGRWKRIRPENADAESDMTERDVDALIASDRDQLKDWIKESHGLSPFDPSQDTAAASRSAQRIAGNRRR